MNILDTAQMKRLRGAVLTMVYTGHREQRSRLDDVALWGLLQDLQFDVSQNDVLSRQCEGLEAALFQRARHR